MASPSPARGSPPPHFAWRVTAMTVFCDDIDDEVTVMVYKDGSIKCTGHKKYCDSRSAFARRSRELGRKLECSGPAPFRISSSIPA